MADPLTEAEIEELRAKLPELLIEHTPNLCPVCRGTRFVGMRSFSEPRRQIEQLCSACRGQGTIGGHAETVAALGQFDRLLASLTEARALLSDAVFVAGNAASHWHGSSDKNMSLTVEECPGCAAEMESAAALDRIRAYLRSGDAPEKKGTK